MILIEIRNKEILIAKAKASGSTIKLFGLKTLDVPGGVLSNDGSYKLSSFKDSFIESIKSLELDYEKEQYLVSIALDNRISQNIDIPKVSDSKIPAVVVSSLSAILDSVDSFVIDSSIQGVGQSEEGKLYNMFVVGVKDTIVKSTVDMFEELGLQIKVLDSSPNGLIKLYNVSDYSGNGFNEHLFVDVSLSGLTYHLFRDSKYVLSVSDHFAFNLDEIETSALDCEEVLISKARTMSKSGMDMDIILMGDPDIIKYMDKKLQRVITPDIFVNEGFQNLYKYTNLIGSAIRKDKYFTKNKKFDINLIDIYSKGSYSRGLSVSQKILIGILVSSLFMSGYAITQSISKKRINNEIAPMENYLNNPLTKSKIKNINELKDKTKMLLEIGESADTIVSVVGNPTAINKEISDYIFSLLPDKSKITNISYNGVSIRISLESPYMTAFSKMAKSLRSHPEFTHVEYAGYNEGSESLPKEKVVEKNTEEEMIEVVEKETSSVYSGEITIYLKPVIEEVEK